MTVQVEESRWNNLTAYASLLTMSRPIPDFILRFISPTGFRTANKDNALPEPGRSIEGYLRKWNAFSELPMQQEPLMKYVHDHIKMERNNLRIGSADFKQYYQRGWIGKVRWKADEDESFLLRMVNALVNYSFFCGTGMKTTQGMGQTIRIS
ncbi:MAG: CRISPR-associated endoribonuclease Cas6 [Dehalococcoidales bacterium]|nr:CRISPR-associated endoribonuclease Cas6 [Dehalococcoidales bacterium]